MRIDSGADRIIVLKDAQTKAGVAGLETRAASGSRLRDKQGVLSDAAVARRIRNELIAGILALICIAAFAYLFFFVLD